MAIGEAAHALVRDARPIVEVEAAQDALDPDVDGKSLEAAIGEKENAVGHFRAHAADAQELITRLGGGQRGDVVEGDFARGDLPGGDEEMPGAKSEAAGA